MVKKIQFDYFDAVDKMMDRGDYVSALHYAFLQRNTAYSSDADVMIADTYMEMNLLDEATRYYMKALAADNKNADAVEGLMYCYMDYHDSTAMYYMHMLMAMDSNFRVTPDEFEHIRGEDPSKLSVHNKRDKSEVLAEAFECLSENDTKGATKILTKIKAGDVQYDEAQLALATIELSESKYDKALERIDSVLDKDNKRSIPALITKLMAYKTMEKQDEMDKLVEYIDSLDVTDDEDVTRVATTMLNFEYYDLAEKYFLRKYEDTPYDKLTLLCLASLCVQKNDKRKALKYANILLTVYPDDIEVKELASRILGDKPFKMPDDFLKLKNEWLSDLKKLLDADVETLIKPENIRKVKWLFQIDDDLLLQAAMCSCVVKIPEYDAVVDEFLIDPLADDVVKKHVLFTKITDERTKKLTIVTKDILRSFAVKHPDVSGTLKYAYYLVFVTLIIDDCFSSQRFYRAFTRLRKAYEACTDEAKSNITVNVLAVILRHLAGNIRIDFLCGVYEADRKDYEEAMKLLKLK